MDSYSVVNEIRFSQDLLPLIFGFSVFIRMESCQEQDAQVLRKMARECRSGSGNFRFFDCANRAVSPGGPKVQRSTQGEYSHWFYWTMLTYPVQIDTWFVDHVFPYFPPFHFTNLLSIIFVNICVAGPTTLCYFSIDLLCQLLLRRNTVLFLQAPQTTISQCSQRRFPSGPLLVRLSIVWNSHALRAGLFHEIFQ